MDIQGSQHSPERAQRTFEQRQRALIEANRALVRAARESLAAAGMERIERAEAQHDEIRLSQAAQAAAEPSSADREAHVRELAEAHRMDRLHTPERLERAAQRLLEG